MMKHLVPRWLRTVSFVVLGIPLMGGLLDVFESEHFRSYLAQVLTSVARTFTTALLSSLLQAIFYGSA